MIMKEPLEDINVIVRDNCDNTITITRDIRPTHNSSRVIRTPEIVVGYFTEEYLERLQDIHFTTVSEPKHETKGIWEKYVSHVIHKNKK